MLGDTIEQFEIEDLQGVSGLKGIRVNVVFRELPGQKVYSYQELLDEIHQVLTWPATDEEIENAMHLVPDDVVQMCTASGSPEEVKAKVREYIDHGCTCPILYPLGDPKLMIDIFSEGYS